MPMLTSQDIGASFDFFRKLGFGDSNYSIADPVLALREQAHR